MTAADDAYDELVVSKAWDPAILRRLLRHARPHLALFGVAFLFVAALFALELVGPWLIRRAIDGPVTAAVEVREATRAAATTPDLSPHVASLGWYALAYLGVVALSALFRWLQVLQLGRAGQAVVHDLRLELFRHMEDQDLAWYDRRPTGALVTRVTADIENINELFTSGLVVLAFDVLKVLVLVGVLFWLDVRLGAFVLAMTPLLVATSLFFRGGARRAHRTVRARLAKLNAYLQEVLAGIRVVQVFRREDRVSRRFGTLLDDYLRSNLRTVFLFALFFPSIELVTLGIKASIVWSGGTSIAAGALTIGVFFQFWFYLQSYLDPIRELGERYNVLQQAFASSERVFEILDTRPRVVPPAPAVARRPQPFRAHVVFEDVSFAYRPDLPVVHGVSFEIPPGRTIAVVGATGAGKSTLVNLLLRFYDPTAGRILVDGIDLRELDPEVWRGRLGLVLQDDFLFTGTVRENVALHRPEATDETIARALAASQADAVVRRLPRGLDSDVAERGVTLSTGERELLAIARALAADPRLVVLDEATASVDSATEARIEEATHALLRGRSALVVAHRLSTVRRADRILVMHHGRLRESGTHAELLAQGGIYSRLHALQVRGADAARTRPHPPSPPSIAVAP